MKKKSNFRKRVMKMAWNLWRAAVNLTWRECMLKAWSLWKLSQRMRRESVLFSYRKVDGSIRRAVGTLFGIPESNRPKNGGKPSYKTMTYYDLERKEFRCFRIENLIEVAM